jgi:hypothetical protein
MNSEEFFTNSTGEYFKTRQGIYVINMPLFKFRGQNIYKVGYARDNLYKRISDYKTAFGPIHFTIEALYEIAEKVFHKRANFALLSETRIHKTLIKMDVANLVMKDDLTDKQLGEWFFGIKDIISVIKGLQDEYENDKTISEVAKKWKLEINPKYKDVRPYLDLVPAKTIKSKMSKIEVIDRREQDRNKAIKLDNNFVYDKEFKKVVEANRLGIGAPKPK